MGELTGPAKPGRRWGSLAGAEPPMSGVGVDDLLDVVEDRFCQPDSAPGVVFATGADADGPDALTDDHADSWSSGGPGVVGGEAGRTRPGPPRSWDDLAQLPG